MTRCYRLAKEQCRVVFSVYGGNDYIDITVMEYDPVKAGWVFTEDDKLKVRSLTDGVLSSAALAPERQTARTVWYALRAHGWIE